VRFVFLDAARAARAANLTIRPRERKAAFCDANVRLLLGAITRRHVACGVLAVGHC